MPPERIAYIGCTTVDPEYFIKSAELKSRRFSESLSPKSQIKNVFNEYLTEQVINAGKKEKSESQYWIITDNQNDLLKAGRDMLNETNKEDLRKFFTLLTLVKLGSEVHSVRIDETTGIKVAELIKEETPYPIHPTPDS